ncbi:GNAT family N-acetyltransferase [Alkaliphilus serpentinus]|uniref:Uncharacterized protein n=1 Tax=Alkaliphilus serpentinus TaxID=1482731 RepID=A0A833M9V9_9FIRM|nr:hypothetical protein [Alkaliphilus serpentinus]KAB3529404.1 hypothetical protein F8153_09225 [Alkaliphilus serpentinus]
MHVLRERSAHHTFSLGAELHQDGLSLGQFEGVVNTETLYEMGAFKLSIIKWREFICWREKTNEFMGLITLRVANTQPRGEIGYWIGRKFWRMVL